LDSTLSVPKNRSLQKGDIKIDDGVDHPAPDLSAAVRGPEMES
jgi:hypothetical protein